MPRKKPSKWQHPKQFFEAAPPARRWQDDRDDDLRARARPAARPVKPLTEKHLLYQALIRERKVVLAVSPAGCGKTSLACAVAVEMLLAGKIDKILVARPLAQCDEDLGTLPGDLGEKLAPYIAPMLVVFRELLGAGRVEAMLRDQSLEICPLAVMRGRTFFNTFCLLDEAQNCTEGQLKMAMSRLGENSHMVVNGDVNQCDLGRESPLIDAWRRLSAAPRHPDIGFVRLTEAEQLRPELVNFITGRLG